MADLPRVRTLQLTDFKQAGTVIGEFFRDVISWMTRASDVDIRAVRVTVGQPFRVQFRFVPGGVSILQAVDVDGTQWPVSSVPTWTRNGTTVTITALSGVPDGALMNLTVCALKAGS